jgi:hypothetical protein
MTTKKPTKPPKVIVPPAPTPNERPQTPAGRAQMAEAFLSRPLIDTPEKLENIHHIAAVFCPACGNPKSGICAACGNP